ncbi:MAG: MFS transporter [Chloroflexi bacterium]|nr:MFS transporter [Chloroflexota bacterium]
MSQPYGAPAAARPRVAALRPFDSPAFRTLWVATSLWHFARWMDIIVVGWLVLELTNSPWHVGLIGFYRSLPMMVFGLFGGAFADQFDRRKLITATQFVNLLVTGAVAILVGRGSFTFEWAALASLCLGFTWAIDWPTRRALVPDLVGKELLLNAILLDNASMNVTKAIGPLVGGTLILLLGYPGCYVLLGLIYMAELALLLWMAVPAASIAVRRVSMLRYLADGWSEIRRSEAIVGVLAVTVAMNFFAFPHQSLLPVFARDVLRAGPIGLGLLAAADGIGSLVGAVGLAALGQPKRVGRLFIAGSTSMCLLLVAFSTSADYRLAVALLLLAGLAHSAFSAFQSTIILGTSADAVRGRMMGALTLAIGSAPLGTLVVSGLATAASAPLAVGASAAVCAGLVLAWAARFPALRRH